MSADWKLQQALMALRSGANAILAEDEDAFLSFDELPDELAAVDKALCQVVRQVQDSDDMATAARYRATEATERARRFEARRDRYKGLILAAMDTMGWRKREYPEATISMRAPQPGVQIIDETELPEGFIKTKREPDKAAIRTALNNGLAVPGAVLSNGLPAVQIRSN